MHPNLVCAAGFRIHLKQRVAREFFRNLVLGGGFFTTADNRPFEWVLVMAANWPFQYRFWMFKFAMHKRNVGFFNQTAFKLILQKGLGFGILGDNQYSRSVFIEPVHYTGPLFVGIS